MSDQVLSVLPPESINLKEVNKLPIKELEQQADYTFFSIGGGYLQLCAILGAINNKFIDFEDFMNTKTYERYLEMEKQIEKLRSNKRLGDDKKESRIREIETKDDYTKSKKEIAKVESKIRTELGLSPTDAVPTSFNQYIDVRDHFSYLKGKGGSKSAIYEYAKVGRSILQYPDFFKRLAKEVNFDNNRKKIGFIPAIAQRIAKQENKTVEDVLADKDFARSMGKEFREKKIDTIKAEYRLAPTKRKPSSSQANVRGAFPVKKYFTVKRDGVYINGELVLPTEDIKLLSESETKLRKLGSLIKEYMKEIKRKN